MKLNDYGLSVAINNGYGPIPVNITDQFGAVVSSTRKVRISKRYNRMYCYHNATPIFSFIILYKMDNGNFKIEVENLFPDDYEMLDRQDLTYFELKEPATYMDALAVIFENIETFQPDFNNYIKNYNKVIAELNDVCAEFNDAVARLRD